MVVLLTMIAFASDDALPQAPGSSSGRASFEGNHTADKRKGYPGEASDDAFSQSMSQAKDAAEKRILDVLREMVKSGGPCRAFRWATALFLRRAQRNIEKAVICDQNAPKHSPNFSYDANNTSENGSLNL